MIMGAAENKQLMQRIFAEFAKGNPELFLANMADDFRWTIIGTTKFSGTFQGKQAVMDKLLTPLIAQRPHSRHGGSLHCRRRLCGHARTRHGHDEDGEAV
jgi:ketosteroid isomerase-like protein